MPHITQKYPYRGTPVSYHESKMDIQEMLVEAGAIGLNWKESIFSLKMEAMPELQFALRAIRDGNEFKFAVLIKPPMLMKHLGKSRYSEQKPDPDASMRLLYWYIKARLEGVQYGLEDVFEAFFSRVVTALPDGTASTMSETVTKHPEVIKNLLPTFTINVKSLTDQNFEDEQQ